MAAAKAAEPVIIVTRTDCNRLADYYLADLVSILFEDDERQPVTATGESPAAQRLVALEDIAIDITRDIQRRLGLPDESILLRPEAGVGTAVVKPDGRVTINGHLLSDAEAYGLASLCRNPGQIVP